MMVVGGCRFEELRSSQDRSSLWASARLGARTSPRRTVFVSRGNHHQLLDHHHDKYPRTTTLAMGHSAGLRAGTRYAFSRDFKKRGYVSLPDDCNRHN